MKHSIEKMVGQTTVEKFQKIKRLKKFIKGLIPSNEYLKDYENTELMFDVIMGFNVAREKMFQNLERADWKKLLNDIHETKP